MSINQTSPWVVLPEPRLPPVMLFPGATPAQDARCAGVGKRDMSTPISAMMHSAARLPTPVMVLTWSRACVKGTSSGPVCAANKASTRWSSRETAHSRWSAWSRLNPMSRLWWSLKRPCSAWRSAGIFCRSLPLARSARTSGLRSPAISAVSIARPETPRTSEATESSLIPASSRVFWIRWHSDVCACTSRLRYRVRSRNCRIAAGGTKLPRSRPCSSSSANHSASSTSLLRPGTIFTCWALTSFSSANARSSSTYQTGFQYDPVASITTCVTPSATNHSVIASSDAVKDENVRVCLRRPRPLAAGARTHATTSFLPISIPAHRSTNTSTAASSPSAHTNGPAGPTDQRRCEACTRTTVRGAGKAPGISLRSRLTRTTQERAQPAHPHSHPPRRPGQAMEPSDDDRARLVERRRQMSRPRFGSPRLTDARQPAVVRVVAVVEPLRRHLDGVEDRQPLGVPGGQPSGAGGNPSERLRRQAADADAERITRINAGEAGPREPQPGDGQLPGGALGVRRPVDDDRQSAAVAIAEPMGGLACDGHPVEDVGPARHFAGAD